MQRYFTLDTCHGGDSQISFPSWLKFGGAVAGLVGHMVYPLKIRVSRVRSKTNVNSLPNDTDWMWCYVVIFICSDNSSVNFSVCARLFSRVSVLYF